jgi:anti-sigma B factor antagonist
MISKINQIRRHIMTISKTLDGDKLIIAVEGRLDTLTAPDLEKEVSGSLDNVNELVFDFEKLEYISSAGLRVLLAIQQMMDGKPVKVTNVSEVVQEVFEVTGFSDIITVE